MEYERSARLLATLGVVLLAASGGRCDDPAPPRFVPPVAPSATRPARRKKPVPIVRLTGNGEIHLDLSAFPLAVRGVQQWPRRVSLSYLGHSLQRLRRWDEGRGAKILTTESSLIVEVRFDRNAAWSHVRFVLWEMQLYGFYKVRIAATREAGPEYSVEEARRLGVPRRATKEDDEPKTNRVGPRLLCLDVSMSRPWLDVWRKWPRVTIVRNREGRIRYDLPKKRTANPRDVQRWAAEVVRDLPKGAGLALAADPDVPFAYAVVLLDRLQQAGAKRVWWAEQPENIPAEFMLLEKLPPPASNDDDPDTPASSDPTRDTDD